MLSLIRRVPYWYPLVLSTKTVKACSQNPAQLTGPVSRPDQDVIQRAPFSSSCIGRRRLLRTMAGRTGIVPHKMADRHLEPPACYAQRCASDEGAGSGSMPEETDDGCNSLPCLCVYPISGNRRCALTHIYRFRRSDRKYAVQCRFRQLAGSMSGNQSEAHSRPKTRRWQQPCRPFLPRLGRVSAPLPPTSTSPCAHVRKTSGWRRQRSNA